MQHLSILGGEISPKKWTHAVSGAAGDSQLQPQRLLGPDALGLRWISLGLVEIRNQIKQLKLKRF